MEVSVGPYLPWSGSLADPTTGPLTMENQSGKHFKCHGIHRGVTPIYSFHLLVGELCFSAHKHKGASGSEGMSLTSWETQPDGHTKEGHAVTEVTRSHRETQALEQPEASGGIHTASLHSQIFRSLGKGPPGRSAIS